MVSAKVVPPSIFTKGRVLQGNSGSVVRARSNTTEPNLFKGAGLPFPFLALKNISNFLTHWNTISYEIIGFVMPSNRFGFFL